MIRPLTKPLLLAAAVLVLPGQFNALTGAHALAAQNQGAGGTSGNFGVFRNPDLVRALYEGNMPALNANKLRTMLYLSPIVEAFDASDVFYRIGMDAEVTLDPQLAPVMRGKVATDPNITRAFMGMGAGTLMAILETWGEERRRQVARGAFDPAGEIAALQKGTLQGVSDLNSLKADAGMDAKRLMLVARDDPEAFKRIYESIRRFIYSY